MLRREGGDVVEAWVMDHKSGSTTLDDSAFQTRIDHYTPQLEAYAKVVQERWGLPQTKVHCVLIFFERGEVVEVQGRPKFRHNLKIMEYMSFPFVFHWANDWSSPRAAMPCHLGV